MNNREHSKIRLAVIGAGWRAHYYMEQGESGSPSRGGRTFCDRADRGGRGILPASDRVCRPEGGNF